MDKPLHIKLLEHLSQNDLGKRVDIAPFIVANFKKPNLHSFNDWFVAHVEADNFLNDLKFRVFIKVEEESTVTFFFDKKEEDVKVKKWYDDAEMYGFVTSTGLDYLQGYNLIQSNKNVNEASLRNYKSQKYISRVTIIIALVAAGFSVADFFKPEPKMAELNRNIQVLSKETEGIKLQIENLQGRLPSLAGKSRKP